MSNARRRGSHLKKLTEEAKSSQYIYDDKVPGADDMLTYLQFEYFQSEGDYTDYLIGLNVRHKLGVSAKDFFDEWSDLEKILAHLIHIGPIAQKKAMLVYSSSRLAAVVHSYNQSRTEPPYINNIAYKSAKGGKPKTYFLSNRKPVHPKRSK